MSEFIMLCVGIAIGYLFPTQLEAISASVKSYAERLWKR